MTTEVKVGYNAAEMKKTVKEMLRYMSGTSWEHDVVMTLSDYQEVYARLFLLFCGLWM